MNIKDTPIMNVLHPEALITLSREYHTAYQENFEKTKTLEDYRDDYKTLKGHLQKLPDQLSYHALIPLGPKALAFGKIIHTNEIMCLLGDNYFMECSAKSAVDMVDRRIKKCDELLKERYQEGERLENWKSSITKLVLETGEQETMEIVEEVDDEKYIQQKLEHRENVRRYKQNLAKEKQEKTAEQKKHEEEEFWAKLEALELEEDLMKAEKEKTKRQQKKVMENKVKKVLKKETVEEKVENQPSSSSSEPKKQHRVWFKDEPTQQQSLPTLEEEQPPLPTLQEEEPPTSNVPPPSEVPRRISLFKQRKAMNDHNK